MRTRHAAVTVALALVLGGCVNGSGLRKPETRNLDGARTGGSGPGSLVSATEARGLDPAIAEAGIRAAHITYRSTDGGTTRETVVSGTVLAPDGEAPEGGWPVIGFGHGTTGLDTECAPSAIPDLGGSLDLMVQFVRRGYVVTLSDFQGLGSAGIHPYTDARTAGFNIIDSVRAARSTFKDVSDRWAGFGGSQGGAAVWSAAEQASSYAPELELVGALAISPAADLTALVDKAVAGTLTSEQRYALQWILVALGRVYPDLDLDDYRTGEAARRWDELSRCQDTDRDAIIIGPMDLAPRSDDAARLVKSYLGVWALPQRELSAPLLVVYGARDVYIDPPWTTSALRKACALGGVVQRRLDPLGEHDVLDLGDPFGWIADRFANKPAANECLAR